MEPRDWFILFFTFAVGLMAGMYFYVTVYAPTYVNDDLSQDKTRISDFSIIGVTYGGLTPQNYINPSVRINGDGSYNYYRGGTSQPEKENGNLPKVLINEIENAISTSDLEALSTPVSNKNCVSYSDGIDYEYSLEIKGIEYLLDTCLTAFDNATKLGSVLLKVWEFGDAPNEYRFSITNTPAGLKDDGDGIPTVREYFEDGFKESGFEN